MLSSHPTVKHYIDSAAVVAGLLSFFKSIPWPEIAGFLSCVWLLLQIGQWVYKRVKG